MNLKNLYENDKGFREVSNRMADNIINLISFIIAIIVLGLIVQFLYNYVAPVWSLPKLGYREAMATITLLKLMSIFLCNRMGQTCINQKTK